MAKNRSTHQTSHLGRVERYRPKGLQATERLPPVAGFMFLKRSKINSDVMDELGFIRSTIEGYEKDLNNPENNGSKANLRSLICSGFEDGLEIIRFTKTGDIDQPMIDFFKDVAKDVLGFIKLAIEENRRNLKDPNYTGSKLIISHEIRSHFKRGLEIMKFAKFGEVDQSIVNFFLSNQELKSELESENSNSQKGAQVPWYWERPRIEPWYIMPVSDWISYPIIAVCFFPFALILSAIIVAMADYPPLWPLSILLGILLVWICAKIFLKLVGLVVPYQLKEALKRWPFHACEGDKCEYHGKK